MSQFLSGCLKETLTIKGGWFWSMNDFSSRTWGPWEIVNFRRAWNGTDWPGRAPLVFSLEKQRASFAVPRYAWVRVEFAQTGLIFFKRTHHLNIFFDIYFKNKERTDLHFMSPLSLQSLSPPLCHLFNQYRCHSALIWIARLQDDVKCSCFFFSVFFFFQETRVQ